MAPLVDDIIVGRRGDHHPWGGIDVLGATNLRDGFLVSVRLGAVPVGLGVDGSSLAKPLGAMDTCTDSPASW